MREKTVIFLLLVITVFYSCEKGKSSSLAREDLFKLSYGKMEDQLDIVQNPGTPFDTGTKIVMRNGFFYIMNHYAGKLMKFNSYGDIVELYYNEIKILNRFF